MKNHYDKAQLDKWALSLLNHKQNFSTCSQGHRPQSSSAYVHCCITLSDAQAQVSLWLQKISPASRSGRYMALSTVLLCHAL